MLEVHEEYHQLIEDKDKQEEDEVWFDKLDKNVCIFKHKVHKWLKQGEESLKRESQKLLLGRKSHSSRSSSKFSESRSSNVSTKAIVIANRIGIAELKADASFVQRRHATEYEREALRIQEQMTKAEARAKVFEMMDKHSTKSEADFMKRKDPTVQQRAIERDICNDLLYLQHQQHLDHPRTQLLNEVWRRSVDNESNYAIKKGDRTFGIQRSSIEVSDVLCHLLKQQSAPDVNINDFNRNLLKFKSPMTLFREVVESKIGDARGRLTHLIKYTKGEAKLLIKHRIEQPVNKGYENAITLLYRNMDTNTPWEATDKIWRCDKVLQILQLPSLVSNHNRR